MSSSSAQEKWEAPASVAKRARVSGRDDGNVPAMHSEPMSSDSMQIPKRSLRMSLAPPEWVDAICMLMRDAEASDDLPLYMLEVFAGVGNIAKAFVARGMPALAFDRTYESETTEDVLHEKGLHKCLAMLIRVREKGLVWMAPQCSTWVWVSRFTYKRSAKQPLGDETHPDVQEANLVADVVAKIIIVCRALRIHYVVEQPSSSLLWHHPAINSALVSCGGGKASVQLGRMGAASAKPLTLCGSAPWLVRLAAWIRVRPLPVQLESLAPVQGGWVSGRRDALAASSAYPVAFAEAIAAEHEKVVGPAAASDRSSELF